MKQQAWFTVVFKTSQSRNVAVASLADNAALMALVLLLACHADQRRQLLPMLQAAGHLVLIAERVETGVRMATEQPPDLVVLMADSPGREGLRALPLMRASAASSPVPVVVISPYAGDDERILAYELGACDVVPYPVSDRELALRVDAVAGRREAAAAIPSSLAYGDLRIDSDARRAWVGMEEKPLTALEFDLLAAILRSSGRVLSRRQLLVQVWRGRVGGETRTVDTHVKRLRKKLGRAAAYVETVRGVGYRLSGSMPQPEAPAPRKRMAAPRARNSRGPSALLST